MGGFGDSGTCSFSVTFRVDSKRKRSPLRKKKKRPGGTAGQVAPVTGKLDELNPTSAAFSKKGLEVLRRERRR